MKRYENKPMYILLENLVLHSIGKLDEEQYQNLRSIEKHLQELYGRKEDWVTLLKSELDLPSDFEDKVRIIWERNCKLANDSGSEMEADSFARLFVDTNFM